MSEHLFARTNARDHRSRNRGKRDLTAKAQIIKSPSSGNPRVRHVIKRKGARAKGTGGMAVRTRGDEKRQVDLQRDYRANIYVASSPRNGGSSNSNDKTVHGLDPWVAGSGNLEGAGGEVYIHICFSHRQWSGREIRRSLIRVAKCDACAICSSRIKTPYIISLSFPFSNEI